MTDRHVYPPPAARERFGKTLTAWANKNGWIHSTLHEWGEQAGFPAVRDSSFNKLQNARTEQPAPLTFIQLAIANSRVAASDYSGVSDQQLKARLEGSVPITNETGTPWGAMEFFGHFIGEIEPPEWAAMPEPLSVEEAAALSHEHREQFASIAQSRGCSLAEAWRDLESHCAHLSRVHKDLLRDVLSGWHLWTPEELVEIQIKGNQTIDSSLVAWANSKQTTLK